jgi:hypothetical protein
MDFSLVKIIDSQLSTPSNTFTGTLEQCKNKIIDSIEGEVYYGFTRNKLIRDNESGICYLDDGRGEDPLQKDNNYNYYTVASPAVANTDIIKYKNTIINSYEDGNFKPDTQTYYPDLILVNKIKGKLGNTLNLILATSEIGVFIRKQNTEEDENGITYVYYPVRNHGLLRRLATPGFQFRNVKSRGRHNMNPGNFKPDIMLNFKAMNGYDTYVVYNNAMANKNYEIIKTIVPDTTLVGIPLFQFESRDGNPEPILEMLSRFNSNISRLTSEKIADNIYIIKAYDETIQSTAPKINSTLLTITKKDLDIPSKNIRISAITNDSIKLSAFTLPRSYGIDEAYSAALPDSSEPESPSDKTKWVIIGIIMFVFLVIGLVVIHKKFINK